MLTIALIVLGLLVVVWLVIWLTTPEPEVPFIASDGYPTPSRTFEDVKPSPASRHRK